jgi:MFS family permease
MPEDSAHTAPPDHEKRENHRPVAMVPDTSTFASLKLPDFRRLFAGTLFSNAAQWIQQVTLSWLVYSMTGSGTMLGIVNVVRSISSIGVIPFAGNLIDKSDRRKLLVFVNGYLFVITFTLGILLLFGHSYLWLLLVFSFLGGTAQTFDHNLRQIIVFNVVPRHLTPNAVALIQTGWGVMRSFGPALGGFLILWFGPGGNFLVQALAHALISITIIRLSSPPHKPGIQGTHFLQNMKEGIAYILKSPVTRAFTLMGYLFPLLVIPIFMILPPIYAVDVFGGRSDTLGFLMAAVGVGGTFGGLVAASLGNVERRGIVQLTALFLLSLSLIAFALSGRLPTALFFLALAGFFEIIFLTSNQTLLQLSIPDAMRGRVTSVTNLNVALAPLGGLIAGGGSDLFDGPQAITIILASLTGLVAVLAMIFSPSIRNYRMSTVLGIRKTTDPKI